MAGFDDLSGFSSFGGMPDPKEVAKAVDQVFAEVSKEVKKWQKSYMMATIFAGLTSKAILTGTPTSIEDRVDEAEAATNLILERAEK